MKIITLDQIKEILPSLDLLPAIKEGFAAYSAGKAVVPPVGGLKNMQFGGDHNAGH